MAWTTPRTWVAGEKVTAANLNTHIRDNFNAFGAAWRTFTPVWGSTGTQPAIGNGTLNGRYAEMGKIIFQYTEIVMGSTTTFGTGTYTFGMPKLARSMNINFGLACWTVMNSVGAGTQFIGFPRYNSTSSYRLTYETAAGAGSMASDVTPTAPFTFASSDRIRGFVVYEAA